MWEWLQQQAQSASPFIATFCLLATAASWYCTRLVFKQMMYERGEHRISEKESTLAMHEVGQSLQRFAASQEAMNTAIMPVLVELAERARRR